MASSRTRVIAASAAMTSTYVWLLCTEDRVLLTLEATPEAAVCAAVAADAALFAAVRMLLSCVVTEPRAVVI